MRTGSILCVGIAVVDYAFEVDLIPEKGLKVRASRRQMRCGGPAATAAVACANLGIPVTFWGRLGRDTEGDFVRRSLVEQGVDIASVVETEENTVVAVVIVDKRGERLIVAHGVGDRAGAAGLFPMADVARARAVLADCIWPDASDAALTAARAAGVPGVLDAEETDRETLLRLVRRADVPVFSEGAAQMLCNGRAPTRDTVAGLAEQVSGDFGITLGERGSLWRIDGAFVEVPAFPVAIVDTTGAGDVFHGGIVAGLAEGMPLIAAARFASACAALKCAAGNGWQGMPSRREVEALLAKR